MRVSTDQSDKAYTEVPHNVWCNDKPIDDWVTADDFRRCVITRDGTVHNGSVRIAPVGEHQESPPIQTGFVGVFEAEPKVELPAPAAPAKKSHIKRKRR